MIDVKSLRIGNFVLLDGERVEIDEISISGQVGCITQDNDWLGVDANDRLSPIPITEELLTELGFEKIKDPQYDYAKRYENNRKLFVTIITGGVVRIEAWDNVIHRGNMICQYLHEIQNFVFMTTKKELI